MFFVEFDVGPDRQGTARGDVADGTTSCDNRVKVGRRVAEYLIVHLSRREVMLHSPTNLEYLTPEEERLSLTEFGGLDDVTYPPHNDGPAWLHSCAL